MREVLPGRQYFLPQTVAKQDPLTASADDYAAILAKSPAPAGKAIYTNFTGISPVMAEEFCYEASIDADRPASELNELERMHLGHTLELAMESIKNGQFSPCIVYREDEPMEFSALPLTSFPPEYQVEHFDSNHKVLGDTYLANPRTSSHESARNPRICAGSSRLPWSAIIKNTICSRNS